MTTKDEIIGRIESLTLLVLSSSKENGEEAIARCAGSHGTVDPVLFPGLLYRAVLPRRSHLIDSYFSIQLFILHFGNI